MRSALALLAFETGGLFFMRRASPITSAAMPFSAIRAAARPPWRGCRRAPACSTTIWSFCGPSRPAARRANRWQMVATPFSNPTRVQPTGSHQVPLTALYRLVQDRRVFLEPLDPALALAEVIASSPIVSADPDRAAALLDRAAQLTRAVPVQRLHFLPDDFLLECDRSGLTQRSRPFGRHTLPLSLSWWAPTSEHYAMHCNETAMLDPLCC